MSPNRDPRTPAYAPLHVEDVGAGAPVLLLHSAGLSGRQWRHLARELAAKGFRAIVPDLSGHGKSEEWPEPRPFSFNVDVERVLALIDGLDRPVHLVGHSYGGFIAMRAARANPRAVASLNLFDPVAFDALRPEDGEAEKDLADVSFAWGPGPSDQEHWLEGFVDYWGGRGAWASLREEARAELRRASWVVHEGARTLVAEKTASADYSALVCPALFLGGERSPVAARSVIERLAKSLPNARAVTIAEAGHMGPLTHSRAVEDLVLEAVSQAERAAGPEAS